MFGFVKRVWSEFGLDKGNQLSAAFAYTVIFSIGPLLLVLLSIVGFVYGQKAANGELYGRLSSAVGPNAAATLQRIIAHSHSTDSGVVAIIFGTLGLILGATALTGQLQQSFDQILRVEPDPAAGLKFTLYTKLKNLTVLIVAATVAIASLAASSVLNGLGKSIWLEVLNNAVSLMVFIAVLFLIYRMLPDVTLPRRLTLKTATAVSVLFIVAKIVLGIIIGHSAKSSAYGAAASFIALLLWFYYSGQILLLGAEGLKVAAEDRRAYFRPKRFAVRIKAVDVRAKKDFRGRLLEAFARGYKAKTKKR